MAWQEGTFLPRLGALISLSPQRLLNDTMLGIIFDWCLLGVFLVQAASYWRDFARSHCKTLQTAVIVLVILNVTQSITQAIAQTALLSLIQNLAFLDYLKLSPTVLIGRVCGALSMTTSHILLTRQCMRFAASIGWSSTFGITLLSVILWSGTAIAGMAGCAAAVAVLVQADSYADGKMTVQEILNQVDWSTFFLRCQFVTCAVVDVLLAATLTLELRSSRSLTRSTAILDGLVLVIVTNGIGLATFEILLCAFHFSQKNFTISLAGLAILGKVYSITSLLSICRPLEIQRDIELATPSPLVARPSNQRRAIDPILEKMDWVLKKPQTTKREQLSFVEILAKQATPREAAALQISRQNAALSLPVSISDPGGHLQPGTLVEDELRSKLAYKQDELASL